MNAGNEKGPRSGSLFDRTQASLLSVDSADVFSLEALLALHHGEFDLLAVTQGAVAVATDGAEVHENVFTGLTLDETETLGVVEPLDGALFAIGHGNNPLMFTENPPNTHQQRPDISEIRRHSCSFNGKPH